MVKDAKTMSYLLTCCFMAGSLTSGIMWPTEGMPSFMREIVKILPMYRPIESVRSILLRKLSINHPMVYGGILNLFIWIVLLSCFLFIKSLIQKCNFKKIFMSANMILRYFQMKFSKKTLIKDEGDL